MPKYTVEVTRVLVAQMSVEANSEEEAIGHARRTNENGELTFYDPEIEDEYIIADE